MAEEVFRILGEKVEGMSQAINAQSIGQMIGTFDGNPTKFREWIKQIDKYAVLMNALNRRPVIAYQASAGVVSDFIQRFLQTEAAGDWNELKRQLTVRFGEIADENHAFALLQRVRQNPKESVPLYAERLMTLAGEAFPGQMGAAVVQRQLTNFFVDGLAHDFLKMKVMRDNSITLDRAVQVAMQEENLRQRFELRTINSRPISQPRPTVRRGEEAMEVDHARHRNCFKCGREGHQARNCRIVGAVGQQSQRPPIQCWKCGKRGHIQRECRRGKGRPQGPRFPRPEN